MEDGGWRIEDGSIDPFTPSPLHPFIYLPSPYISILHAQFSILTGYQTKRGCGR
jgi:hypothetical protein